MFFIHLHRWLRKFAGRTLREREYRVREEGLQRDSDWNFWLVGNSVREFWLKRCPGLIILQERHFKCYSFYVIFSKLNPSKNAIFRMSDYALVRSHSVVIPRSSSYVSLIIFKCIYNIQNFSHIAFARYQTQIYRSTKLIISWLCSYPSFYGSSIIWMIYFSAAHLQFSSLNEIGSILIYKFEKLIFIKNRSTLRPKMIK